MVSNTARMVAFHALLHLMTASVVLGYVYRSISREVEQEFLAFDRLDLEVLTSAAKEGGDRALRRAMDHDIGPAVASRHLLLLTNDRGERLAGSMEAFRALNEPAVRPAHGSASPDVLETGEALFQTRALPGGKRLYAGHKKDDRRELAKTLLAALAGALALGIEAGIIAANVMSRRIRRRLKRVADAVGAFESGNRRQRVQTGDSDDPFDRLGRGLNSMFARIELLMEEMRAITDAVAHDTRSPLTRVRMDLEMAAHARTIAEARPALRRIDAEIDHLLLITNDALEISRAESGLPREMFAPVDLTYMLQDLADAYRPLAAEHGVCILFEAKGENVLNGHQQLLARAIVNLIENALRHAADSDQIVLFVKRHADRISIGVADGGPGIAEHDRERALRRFSRLDPMAKAPGTGLGLSLVKSIAQLHRGELDLHDNRPGLLAVLELPADPLFTKLPPP